MRKLTSASAVSFTNRQTALWPFANATVERVNEGWRYVISRGEPRLLLTLLNASSSYYVGAVLAMRTSQFWSWEWQWGLHA